MSLYLEEDTDVGERVPLRDEQLARAEVSQGEGRRDRESGRCEPQRSFELERLWK
jgi:hypothetical protein